MTGWAWWAEWPGPGGEGGVGEVGGKPKLRTRGEVGWNETYFYSVT